MKTKTLENKDLRPKTQSFVAKIDSNSQYTYKSSLLENSR